MAEAHAAVAFSFHVTPEGLNVRYNHEAIRAVWYSGLRSWKLRMVRFKVINLCKLTIFLAICFSIGFKNLNSVPFLLLL